MNHFKPAVALVDDHVLPKNGLADLIRQLKPRLLPALVLLDINMPEMDGFDTALWLKRNFPEIKILALSMYDTNNSIIRMLKNGAKGYILKDISPAELKIALHSVIHKGFYYSEMVTGQAMHHFLGLNDRETAFLKLVCTEFTYKEIADQMCLSPRTIDGYRDSLFEKLKVKTRVGLVLYAIRNGIVQIS